MAKKNDSKKKSFTLNIGKVNVGQGNKSGPGGMGGAVYGMGFLGSLVYYLAIAPDLWAGILGIVKSIFWPGFLVHGLLKLIGA